MAVTFDGPTLTMTLESGVTAIDAADIYSDWKDWLTGAAGPGPDNSKYPPAFRVDGGAPLTTGINQGSYFFVRNDKGWRIRPPEEDITVYLTGNLVPEDGTRPIMVPTVGAYTAAVFGLQPITQSVAEILSQAQEASYDGAVYLDTKGLGVSGTAYPVGTRSDPVDNRTDALTIAANLGLNEIHLRGTLQLPYAFQDWQIVGVGIHAFVQLNGMDCSETLFVGCNLSGTMVNATGTSRLDRGTLADVTGWVGEVRDSLISGTIRLAAGQTDLLDCESGVVGPSTPIVDFDTQDAQLGVRGYSGGLELRRGGHANTLASVDLVSGHLVISSSMTAGTVVVRGTGWLEDNSGAGCTVNTTGFVSAPGLSSTASISKTLLALKLSE